MRTVPLNGPDWRLAQARRPRPGPGGPAPDIGELDALDPWIPASVPGDVRLDLQRAGRLHADLYHDRHSLESAWVEHEDWWCVRDVDLDLAPGERAHLVLHGVDYISWVFFNGRLLGRHEGMFSAQVYDVTALAAAHNRLAVFILGAGHLPRRADRRERALDRLEAQNGIIVSALNGRRQVVKAQMGFGWDFAPAMRTMGIWDDVELRITGPLAIRDPYARPVLDPGHEHFTLELEIDAHEAADGELIVDLRGATWDAEPHTFRFDLRLAAGLQRITRDVPVSDPRLWFPWDRGRPDLYDLTLTLATGGQPSDTWRARTGLRDVRLARNPGSPLGAPPWTFVVNGQALFARGANWVPADAFPARVTAEDYETLLGLAVNANMNMLRVWGGGLREKAAFYETADRLGLMLWQEFPHACAFTARFPRSPEFTALAEHEARAIVRAVRNHPSVVIWCGGNEFSPTRNRPLVEALQRAAREEDGARPFNPASPSEGESHNWIIWHEQAPISDYRNDHALFASEFGLQSAPDEEVLRRFIPPDQLWPPGPAWAHHNAELGKLAFYARPYLPAAVPTGRAYRANWTRYFASAAEFAAATQRAQADGLQIAVEHFRRRKGRSGGCLVWQFNEPWPAISWALVTYDRRPKPAYERMKQCFQPLLVSLDVPLHYLHAGETVQAGVWVINDWPRAFAGCRVEVTLGAHPAAEGGGAPLWTGTFDIAPDSVARVGEVAFTLPPHGPGAWALVARVWQDTTLLSANDYQLDTHDPRRMSLANRLRVRLTRRLYE
jgi:beta-mannosidase